VKKEIIINSTEYHTRIAMLEDGRLVELLVEQPDAERMVGDIYIGKIQTVLPGMQAAFVDIGMEKAAYLHSSDIGRTDRGRFDSEDVDEEESPADIVRKRRYVGIEKVLKRGQEILVQVIKEPISTKGPRIATEISIAGRYVVLVPDNDMIRVSKRISDWGEKRRLKRVAAPLRPEGFGLIIRTEAEGVDEAAFRSDIKRLLKLWAKLKKKADTEKAPALIHKEAELLISMIRDMFTDDIERVFVDQRSDYKKIISFARQVMPHLKDRVELYKGDLPLFDRFGLEPEIDKMLNRKIWIKKGAYLIIEQTEAMVTIDVNTGRFTGSKDQEKTLIEANLLAAREIARQVRLRDMGGLIVCDFIDMYNRDNRRRLYESFKGFLKNDRAKWGMNPVTEFGLIEMTRERVRPSHMQTLSEPCPHCQGRGRIPSREIVATKIERWFIRARAQGKFSDYHLVVSPNVADTLTENGNRVGRIMRACKVRINVIRDTTIPQEVYKVYNALDNSELTEKYEV